MWVADFGEGIFAKMDTCLCHKSEVRICPEGLKKENLMYGNHFHFQDKRACKGILFPVAIRDSSCCHGPIVSSARVIIPAKQGCGGFTHGVSERPGLDALGCTLALRPSLGSSHTLGNRHISPGLLSFTSVSFNVPNPASSLY